jgi:hypothetical protein
MPKAAKKSFGHSRNGSATRELLEAFSKQSAANEAGERQIKAELLA